MSVHYKFKSSLDFDTITFDGLHISVLDLKKSIFQQKNIGKNTDFDLLITNAQTKEEYKDENVLIPKNTSLIVSRVPLSNQSKRGSNRSGVNQQLQSTTKLNFDSNSQDGTDQSSFKLSNAVDLSRLDASEDDKIRAMMTQSTLDYDPSNYQRIRGANQVGPTPPQYRCYKCQKTGHWIKDCPLKDIQETPDIKKSTGIPRSFMVPVDGPQVPGAMMTPGGTFAVPAIDHQAYKEVKKEKPPFAAQATTEPEKPEIPEDLLCGLCKDLLSDAVLMPCCGDSFCDECIRTVLLESDDQECPACHEKEVSPETLVPSRYLRNSVANFGNQTGYRKPERLPPVQAAPPQPAAAPATPAPDLASNVAPEPVSNVAAPDPAPAAAPVAATQRKSLTPPPTFAPQAEDLPPGETEPQPQNEHHRSSHVDSYTSHSNEQERDSSPPGSGIPVLGGPSMRRSGQDGDRLSGSMHPRGHNHMSSSQSTEGYRHHPGEGRRNRHYPQRRSTEERPGTPTIDERNLESGSSISHSHSHNVPPVHSGPAIVARPPSLPDVSVPPPGMGPPSSYHNIQPIGSQGPTMTREQAPYSAYDPKDESETRYPSYKERREDWSGRYKNEKQLYREWGRHSCRARGPPDRSYAQQRGRDLDSAAGSAGYTVPPHNPITVCQPPAAGGYYNHDAPSGYPTASHSDKYGSGNYRGGYRPRQRGGGMGYRGNGPRPVSNVIDDPLEAFERILREKDRSRKLRRRSRSRSRSFSRSRSRSRSHSPRQRTRTRSRSLRRSLSRSPPPRKRPSFSRSRSRSPPPRRSRSRSRSISRVRRSLTPRRSRSPPPFRSKRSRTRSRSRSRTPRSRSRSFTISKSRSRSRSFSRSLSPRDRRPLSPRHGDRDAPLRLRTLSRSPPRFRARYGEPPPLHYFDADFPYNRGGRGGRGRRPPPPGVGAPLGGPPSGPPPSFGKDYDGPRDSYRHSDPVGGTGTHPHGSRFPEKRYDQKPPLKPAPLGPPGRLADLSAPQGTPTDGASDHSDTFGRQASFHSATDSYHPQSGAGPEYRRTDPPRDDWDKERRRVRERQTTPPPPGTRDLTPPPVGWDRDRPRERSGERSLDRPRDRSRDRSSKDGIRERTPERTRDRPRISPERPRDRDGQTSPQFKERDWDRDLPPREREAALRDPAPPGVRERDNRDRDLPPPGVDIRERRDRDLDPSSDKERDRERDRDRDREKERDIGPPGDYDYDRRERDLESHRGADRERDRDSQYRDRERGIDIIVRDRDIKPRGLHPNSRDARDVPPLIPSHPQPIPLLANPQPYPLHPQMNQGIHPGMHPAAMRMWEMNPLMGANIHDRDYPLFDPREWERDRRDLRGRDRERYREREQRDRERDRDRDRNRERGRDHYHSSPDNRKDRRAGTPSKERSKDRSKDHSKEASSRYSSSSKKSGRDQSKESKDEKHKQTDNKRRTSSPEHKEKIKKEEAKEKKTKEKKKKKKNADEDSKKKKKRKEKKVEIEKEAKKEKSPVEEKVEVDREEIPSPFNSATETVVKAESPTTEVKAELTEDREKQVEEEKDGTEDLNTTVESEPPKTPLREEPILISDQENPPEEPSPAKSAEMLAPLPEPSKWELEEEGSSSAAFDVSSSQETDPTTANAKVTSEVIKRAENAIFHKAISSIRTIEPAPKKTERKVYHLSASTAEKDKKTAPDVQIVENPPDREARESNNTITVTFPTRTDGNGEPAVDSKPKTKLEKSNISPIRVPAKERLGSRIAEEKPKIESVRRVIRNRSRSSSRDKSSRHHRTERKIVKSSAVPVERQRTPSPQYRGRDPRQRTPSPQYRGKDSRQRTPSPQYRGREVRREGNQRSGSRDARVVTKVKESEVRSPEKKKIKDAKKKRQSRSSSREHKKRKKDKKHRKDKKKRDKKDSRKTDSSDDESEEKESDVKNTEESKTEAQMQPSEKEESAASDATKKAQRKNPRLASDRRKSVLDESNFEPNYDASSSGESDQEETAPAGEEKTEPGGTNQIAAAKNTPAQSTTASSPAVKRPASPVKSPEDRKKAKLEETPENGKKEKAKKKKRAKVSSSSESDSSSKEDSSSDDDSSSESSEASSVKKRKKKKKTKKRKAKKKSKKKKVESSSDSGSGSDDASSSDSDVREKRKKKHHRRAKKSSKKKKSKHK